MPHEEKKGSEESKSTSVVLTTLDKRLIIIASLIIVGVFGLYLIYFSNGISTDQSYWGQFGDYFGGTLNPILSFITIIVLIYTLRIGYKTLEISKQELDKATKMLGLAKDEIEVTKKAVENSTEQVTLAKEATEKQVTHLEREALKQELSTIIKEIDTDVQEIFRRTVRADGNTRPFGYYFSRTSDNENVKRLHSKYRIEGADLFAIKTLSELLQDMDFYIDYYEEKFVNSKYTYHYQKKYFDTIKILVEYEHTKYQFKKLGTEINLEKI